MQSGIIARYCSAESLCNICIQIKTVFRNILLFDTLVRVRTLLYVQLVRTGKRPCCDAVTVDSTGNIAVVLLYQIAL